MIRVALTILLPLLAPTAIYFLWLYISGRTGERRAPWMWLAVGGLAAAAAALVTIGVGSGGPRSGTYVPPHVAGDRLVPGQIVPSGGH